MRKNQTEGRRGTRAKGIRGGETLRKRVFILLQGEKILDTNYSCADATHPHERRPFVPGRLKQGRRTQQGENEKNTKALRLGQKSRSVCLDNLIKAFLCPGLKRSCI